MDSEENGIEFLTGQKTATVWFSQRKYINRIKKLATERPEECEITDVNLDGSLVAHVPLSWVRIAPPNTVNFTEEQKAAARERLQKAREARLGEKKNLEDAEEYRPEDTLEDILDEIEES